MRLQTKILSTTMTIFVIGLVFMGIIIFSNVQTIMENQIENSMQSSSVIIEKDIKTFISGQEDKIELIAAQSAITDEGLKSAAGLDPSFYSIFTIDSGGKIIASSNEADIGMDKSEDPYFINARNQTYVKPIYYSESMKQYLVSVSTPFHGGVLVGRISMDFLDNLTNDRRGLGETGENLLGFIDERGDLVFFAGRRVPDTTKIETWVKEQAGNLPIYLASQGREVYMDSIKDYRGVHVLAFTTYIDKINMGLVIKIDEAEAFAPINKLKTK